jgi:hypothetical protein
MKHVTTTEDQLNDRDLLETSHSGGWRETYAALIKEGIGR